MEVCIQNVIFSRMLKEVAIQIHYVPIITYFGIKKYKLVSLFINDLISNPNEIIEIYCKRWDIELLLM